MSGASAAGYGELREVSLIDIVDLIEVIFVAKKIEKVLQSLWLSSLVLAS